MREVQRMDKEFLIKKYWREGLNEPQIAKEVGFCRGTIEYWMNKYNIPRRGLSEIRKKQLKESKHLTIALNNLHSKNARKKAGEKLKTGKLIRCFSCNKEFYKCGAYIKKYDKHFCGVVCRSKYHMGVNVPNWKGGVTPARKKEYFSERYKTWRTSVFERDDYVCQLCHKHSNKLRAHHIKFYSTNPELRFEITNGLTLCGYCHIEVHKGNQVNQYTMGTITVEEDERERGTEP